MKKLFLILSVYSLSFIVILTSSCRKDNTLTPVYANNGGYIYTVAGNGYGAPTIGGYSGDGGRATNAELDHPIGVAIDDSENIYITDDGNQRIRKVEFRTGIIETIGGNGYPNPGGFSGDGGPATNAEIAYPSGIAVDDSGNVYFADQGNYRIRKISRNGIITTYAGDGISGYNGDGGQATNAELSSLVNQIALDNKGNLYIAGDDAKIRMVSTSGIITRFAGDGIGGYSGDGGPATNAELYGPLGVTVDKTGNVYLTDYTYNVVRKVNTSGIITTIAGIGDMGGNYFGDGGAATNADFNEPTSVAVDGSGNVYICDMANGRIRMVNTSGIITTVAGNGTGGYSGDGGPATAAEITGDMGISVDRYGNLYIADLSNNRIRKVYK